MLNRAENELLTLLRASPVASRLRAIDTMPALPDAALVKHFALDAPALYVDSMSFKIPEIRRPDSRFTILAIARQIRPQIPGKAGDGIEIGLHDLVDAVLSLVDGVSTPSFGWRAVAVTFLKNPEFFANGFCPALITLETSAYMDDADETSLADFKTFNADYDLEPHVSGDEHDQWLEEPPNHDTSAPDLTDQQKLQETP